MLKNNSPIGVFDSGVGGLTVASVLMREMPREPVYYYADTGNVPYGPKSPKTIERIVLEILDFLVKKEVKAVVMACNTSSALVLPFIAGRFNVPMIGMIEPGATEALGRSRNRRIGVMANEATVRSNAYSDLLKSMDSTVKVVQKACPLLVPMVEKGETGSAKMHEILKSYLEPLADENIDTLIMGCTHYPFLKAQIAGILGPGVRLVNPAEKAVERLREALERGNIFREDDEPPEHRFFTSGDAEEFRRVGSRFLGLSIGQVEKVMPAGNPAS
jgi:glutamate racemase